MWWRRRIFEPCLRGLSFGVTVTSAALVVAIVAGAVWGVVWVVKDYRLTHDRSIWGVRAWQQLNGPQGR